MQPVGLETQDDDLDRDRHATEQWQPVQLTQQVVSAPIRCIRSGEEIPLAKLLI